MAFQKGLEIMLRVVVPSMVLPKHLLDVQKVRAGVLALMLSCASALSAEDFKWQGSVWEHRHPRTVRGTGAANDRIVIQNSGEAFWLSFTSGVISRVRGPQSPLQILKTETTTYSNIPVTKQGDKVSFALPESGVRFRLRLVSSTDGFCLKGTRELTKDEQMSLAFASESKANHTEVKFYLRRKIEFGAAGRVQELAK